jgi:hypothetical protein
MALIFNNPDTLVIILLFRHLQIALILFVYKVDKNSLFDQKSFVVPSAHWDPDFYAIFNLAEVILIQISFRG